MIKRVIAWTGVLSVAVLARVLPAAAFETTCTLRSMAQGIFAPPDLLFPMPTHEEQLPFTIDETTGVVTTNFGGLPILTFVNPFSQQSRIDTTVFRDETVTGTIDASGHIVLPHVRGINCTQGKCPPGEFPCPCVPGNICSNDTTRVCVAGGTGDLSCPPVPPSTEDGTCQGVCSNDRTRTCASSSDCDPPGFCGDPSAVGMRIDATFSTGTVHFEGWTSVGSAHGAFTDGTLRFVSIHRTPPETFGIGDIGISFIVFTCQLAAVPSPPLRTAGWTVKKGTVKLGKGDPGTGDDAFVLKARFVPQEGEVDFDASDLAIVLATDAEAVTTFVIPAGSLAANRSRTKWKLADKDGSVVKLFPGVPDGASPSHKVSIKKGKTGAYAIALSSKGLNLDAADAAILVTGVSMGPESPSARSPVHAKKQKRIF
ncbi:MAG TPA: hypothetical protein VNO26_03725 [Candidatus Limnocylindria bacterium]|nr:hypothetical protein [Candidatus Limnocylindria bacterium]